MYGGGAYSCIRVLTRKVNREVEKFKIDMQENQKSFNQNCFYGYAKQNLVTFNNFYHVNCGQCLKCVNLLFLTINS